MLKFTFIIIFALAIFEVQAQNSKYSVLSIYDGDTLTLKNSTNGNSFKVRVVCVDAPEIDQDPWGKKSLNRLLQLVPLNSQVNLNITELDQYGRVLAEVLTLNGINTGKKMLTEGLLVRYPYQKNCQAYDLFQNEAKNKKIGVWSDPNFVLPYEYRRTTINPLIG